jgi:hypothetical protein
VGLFIVVACSKPNEHLIGILRNYLSFLKGGEPTEAGLVRSESLMKHYFSELGLSYCVPSSSCSVVLLSHSLLRKRRLLWSFVVFCAARESKLVNEITGRPNNCCLNHCFSEVKNEDYKMAFLFFKSHIFKLTLLYFRY